MLVRIILLGITLYSCLLTFITKSLCNLCYGDCCARFISDENVAEKVNWVAQDSIGKLSATANCFQPYLSIKCVDWCVSCHSSHISGNLSAFPQSVPFLILPKCCQCNQAGEPYETALGSPSHTFQKYPCFLAEHLKGLEYFCGCTTEGLFYSTFDLKCFSIKKRKTTIFWNSLSFSLWDCSTEWLEYYCS